MFCGIEPVAERSLHVRVYSPGYLDQVVFGIVGACSLLKSSELFTVKVPNPRYEVCDVFFIAYTAVDVLIC